MKILALEKEGPQTTAEQFQLHLRAEAARVYQLYQAGLVRELYFHQDHHTAILILECATLDEAHQVLNTLPLVQAGLITFDLIPLAPYPGFSRLFASSTGGPS
jgi:muconolactone delta-isomerase